MRIAPLDVDMMASPGLRKRPLPAFHFAVKINGLPDRYQSGTAFFKSITGLRSETDVTDYQAGGVTTTMQKVIGVRRWPNLVLKQGFTGDRALFLWKYNPTRVSGKIIQLGPDFEEICSWTFSSGYPVRWEGPDFDASKNDLAIETIEIAHEGLELEVHEPPPKEPPPKPAPKEPPPPIDKHVNFVTGSAVIAPDPNPDLDEVVGACRDTDRRVRVEADTDTVGNPHGNKDLSQKRANSVRAYLTAPGRLKPEQVTKAVGFGKERALHGGADLPTIPDNTADPSWRRTRVLDD